MWGGGGGLAAGAAAGRARIAGPGEEASAAPEHPLEPAATLPKRIRHAYREHVDYRRRAALRLWLAFLLTFLVLRGLTYGIRYHFLPVGNIVTGGVHIHHFVWGIFILLIVGFIALSLDSPRWHAWLAIPFGIGAALVIDEFALWLHLEDVYWAAQGRVSVDLAVLVAALFGLYVVALRFWNQVVKEIRLVLALIIRGERRLARRRRAAHTRRP